VSASGPGGRPSLSVDGDERPVAVPCLLLRRGKVCRPGDDGPTVATRPDGSPFDPFDVLDRLRRDYTVVYLVDLDGIERQEPQLDFIQEFSRDVILWVDGGVRTADQSIDILVAGARRAVVSSAMLGSARELKRAWRLSPELIFEIELHQGVLQARPDWEATDPVDLARRVREIGPDHLIVSPRDSDPDWALVRTLAAGGPTWVDGSYRLRDAPQLAPNGAVGGIFHIDAILDEGRGHGTGDPLASTDARDDEDQNQLNHDE